MHLEDLLTSYQDSLEKLVSANDKIRKIESTILMISKDMDVERADILSQITLLLDDLQSLLDDVDLRTNHLDVQISAIERLISS
jgi:uncharacterized protein YoxC